ncbi:hypothetical protein OESDEN_25246 [Oesophagostomum dentatum]|uniref:Uncharacterized protein n=1 Tax=Oesophagostomum dentatum TaxID=61180 RepID=A0A0B1RQ36_OESDE|nr:hypothetical protein OESDEN_25246 [Oesophagostomum dentatum]
MRLKRCLTELSTSWVLFMFSSTMLVPLLRALSMIFHYLPSRIRWL